MHTGFISTVDLFGRSSLETLALWPIILGFCCRPAAAAAPRNFILAVVLVVIVSCMHGDLYHIGSSNSTFVHSTHAAHSASTSTSLSPRLLHKDQHHGLNQSDPLSFERTGARHGKCVLHHQLSGRFDLVPSCLSCTTNAGLEKVTIIIASAVAGPAPLGHRDDLMIFKVTTTTTPTTTTRRQ